MDSFGEHEMRRPLIVLIVTGTLTAFGLWYAVAKHYLQRAELIDCIGYYFVLASLVLLYFQLKSGMLFERRRATNDFLHGPITQILLPLEKQLKAQLNRPLLLFAPNETARPFSTATSRRDRKHKELLIDMLNFYERMALAVRSSILDEDIVYDDKGVLLLNYYRWVKPVIEELKTIEPRAFVNLCALADDWSKRYSQEDSKQTKRMTHAQQGSALKRRNNFS
jgi:hypothetical protein